MNTNTTLFHMFLDVYENNKNNLAFIYRVLDNEFKITYEKLFEDVLLLSREFATKKVSKNSKVMFLCDNRYEWMVTDLALISLGAISIPRGSDTPTNELEFIMKHSECEFLICENKNLYDEHEEMIKTLKLKAIFILEGENIHSLFDNIYAYNDILKDRKIYNNDIEDFLNKKIPLPKMIFLLSSILLEQQELLKA